MKRLALLLAASIAALLAGCGGGGGGGHPAATLIGRVLNVETGGPLNPPATVQTASASTNTLPEDGSFSVKAPNGATSLTVIPNQTGWSSGNFSFTFPAAQDTTAVGDLWVGPEKVTVTGRVLNSTNNVAIAGAAVSFGGILGTTDANGVFTLANVAYSSTTQTAFWGILGTARASGFFKTDFSAAPNVSVAGVVNVGDVLLTPSNDPNPPGTPYNVWGKVLPIGGSQGTVVTLKSGGTDVRIFNVAADGFYYFWITPGTYTVTFQKGAQSAPTQNVSFTQPNDVVRVPDVTLSP